MKKDLSFAKEYCYKGIYIYQITKRDYAVYDENGLVFSALTLKQAKANIDNM